MTINIAPEELLQFCAEMIEGFEDFLDSRGIVVYNEEKDDAISDGEDPESICTIYGTDFGEIQCSIEDILRRWAVK